MTEQINRTPASERIVCNETGVPALNICLPRDWKATYVPLSGYFGYNNPFGFRVLCENSKRTACIKYIAPLNYIDD